MSQCTVPPRKEGSLILMETSCSGPILNFLNSFIKLSTEHTEKLKMHDLVAR